LIGCAGAFTHRFLRFEMDFVGIVHEPVEDGVGERRIADVVVPEVERKLAGDERRAAADTVIEEFEQVTAFARAEGRNGEVIDHHDAAFDGAWQEGRCLTLDQAIDLALAKPVEGG
jgi:hypothetical protein